MLTVRGSARPITITAVSRVKMWFNYRDVNLAGFGMREIYYDAERGLSYSYKRVLPVKGYRVANEEVAHFEAVFTDTGEPVPRPPETATKPKAGDKPRGARLIHWHDLHGPEAEKRAAWNALK